MNWPAFGERPTTLELWKPVCTETADKREAEEARRSHTHIHTRTYTYIYTDTFTASMHTRIHTHLFFFITPLFVRRLSGCLLLEGLSLTLRTSWDPLGLCLCVCMCPISKCNRLHSTSATSTYSVQFLFISSFTLTFSLIYRERKWILNRDNNNIVKWNIIISDNLKEKDILSLSCFFFFFEKYS